MKNTFFLLALISFPILKSFAQSFPDPEISLRPYLLQADNSLKNLERADGLFRLRRKGLGYGGEETYYEVSSPKSETSLSKSSLPRIIIKVPENVDISEQLYLCKSEDKKNDRKFILSALKFMNQKKDISDPKLKLEFKKIRDGIYEIILPASLGSGEYALLFPIIGSIMDNINKQTKISCFGIY